MSTAENEFLYNEKEEKIYDFVCNKYWNKNFSGEDKLFHFTARENIKYFSSLFFREDLWGRGRERQKKCQEHHWLLSIKIKGWNNFRDKVKVDWKKLSWGFS